MLVAVSMNVVVEAAASATTLLLGVCGIPKYGSESELQKLNRALPHHSWNSEKVGIPTFCGIPTFSEFQHMYNTMDDMFLSFMYNLECDGKFKLLISRYVTLIFGASEIFHIRPTFDRVCLGLNQANQLLPVLRAHVHRIDTVYDCGWILWTMRQLVGIY